MKTRLAVTLGIGLALLAPASSDAAAVKCGAAVRGTVVLDADLLCPSGHGLVVGAGAKLNCAGHRIAGGDRSGQYGIYVRDGSGAVVKNCVVEGFEVGIRVRAVSGGAIKRNVAQGNVRYGIEVTHGSTAIRIIDNDVLDNGDEGIHLSGPEDRDAGHLVQGNVVDGNALEGIYVLRSDGNWITGNTVRDHGAAGIYVKGSSGNTLDGNTLINDPLHIVYGSELNVLVGNTIVGQQIRFKEASNNQVYGLIVKAAGGRPGVAYEFMSSSGNLVADSQALQPSDYDIRATSSSTGNVFTRFSVTPKLECSVDSTSSVRVTDGRGVRVACGR